MATAIATAGYLLPVWVRGSVTRHTPQCRVQQRAHTAEQHGDSRQRRSPREDRGTRYATVRHSHDESGVNADFVMARSLAGSQHETAYGTEFADSE